MPKKKTTTNGRSVDELLILLQLQMNKLKYVRLDPAAEADVVMSAFEDGRRVVCKMGFKWGGKLFSKGDRFPFDPAWRANITKLAQHRRFILQEDVERGAGWSDASQAVKAVEEKMADLVRTRALQEGSDILIQEFELNVRRLTVTHGSRRELDDEKDKAEQEKVTFDRIGVAIVEIEEDIAKMRPSLEAALIE